jgi:hypothetical protein
MIPYLLAIAGGYLIGSASDKQLFAKGGSTLLAPNGKPSNLTPEQWHLVRTPEFKAWFGDWEKAYETGNYDGVSKVIDEETKEPLVVYHGTNIKVFFTIFNPKKDGIWVSSNKEIAKSYGNRIIEMFLNLRKPTTEKIWRKVRDKHYEENKGQFWQYDEFDIPHNDILELMYKNIRNVICKKGYDSIKLDKDFFEEGTENFIAFNSNQIKLADGTNTTFDANNPDIRYAKGGETNKSQPQSQPQDIIFNQIGDVGVQKLIDFELNHLKAQLKQKQTYSKKERIAIWNFIDKIKKTAKDLKKVPLNELNPTQFGEDYKNPSSENNVDTYKKVISGEYNSDDVRIYDFAPLLIDKNNNNILDGNHRHYAFSQIGVPYVYVLYVDSGKNFQF